MRRDPYEVLGVPRNATEEEITKQAQRAKQILDSARASSEFIFRQLEDLKKQEDKEKRADIMTRAKDEIRAQLRKSEALMSGIDLKEINLDEDYKLPRSLKVKDRVYVTTLGVEGEITAIDEKKKLYSVSAGILKAKVDESKLRLLEGNVKFRRAPEVKRPSEGKVKKSIASSFKTEVDVRGMIGDDAWFVVDKYLDDAVLAGIPSVRVIHGKGTGALRAALWKYFKADKRIKSYRHGEWGEGDAGVTVIEFKQ